MSAAAIPAPASRPKVDVAGVHIDNLSMAEALDAVATLAGADGAASVLTPNADHVVRVQKDPEFAAMYREASLVLADGMPVVWAARFLGTPLQGRVSGADLFMALCERAAGLGHRVFLLGGQPGAAEEAGRRLQARHPGLQIAGHLCPPHGFDRDPAWNERIVRQLREARPHLLFVALGSPKQERWIRRHQAASGVPVAIGVGASIDFAAGAVRRAPPWMQRAGLEWLWRLLMEPTRLWRRYLVDDPKFFWYVARQRWRRSHPAPPAAPP